MSVSVSVPTELGQSITARGLTRTFRTRNGVVEAVRGLDLDVRSGEIVGFLGPNGAGKSTTLRLLTTLLAPSSGEATVAGCDLLRDPAGVRRRIGYVAQAGGADPRCRVRDELEQQAGFYGMRAAEARHRAAEVCAMLDLAEVTERHVKTLSGGQRRRVDIALGVTHRPSLIFLDEPTTGLDPQSRGNLWEHVRRLRAEHGVTVFLTTHYLDEADALCDRVLIVDRGTIVAEGSPAELKRRIGGDVLTIQITHSFTRAAELLERRHPGRVVADGRVLRVTTSDGDRDLVEALLLLTRDDVGLGAVHRHTPTLDDVFLALTGRSLREGN